MRRSYGKSCKNENARRVPSDYLEFARCLVRCGIDSISLNPDTVLKIICKGITVFRYGCKGNQALS